MLNCSRSYLEAFGLQGTPLHRIALLAERMDGIYDLETHGGIHKEAPKV